METLKSLVTVHIPDTKCPLGPAKLDTVSCRKKERGYPQGLTSCDRGSQLEHFWHEVSSRERSEALNEHGQKL